ncbi:MAG: hypothetical protein ACTSRQ_11850 [Candidatus Thorarchaeota archaeon]
MTNDFLDTVRPYLLPNEEVEFTCRTQSGFVILSSRRFIILNEEKRDEYCIEKSIPYGCISSIEHKKIDRFEITGIVLDQYGHRTSETRSFIVKAPKEEREKFQSTMNRCFDVIEEIRNSDDKSSHYGNSYLENMPESLTKNARLDLNTVLRDQPIPDSLIHEAMEFLGAEPFILEDSLKDSKDKENGILFAVGERGYYWIRGKKTGRFMSDVIIDTIEWDNIKSFSYRWETQNAIIEVTYSLTSDGKASTTQYQWSPLVNDDTLHYPWLLQQMNGPWILADIISKYGREGESFHSPSYSRYFTL